MSSCHMFGQPCASRPDLFPFGIYTIPEISMVGKTEQQLTAEKIPYEFGVAKYEELARALLSAHETLRLAAQGALPRSSENASRERGD